MDGLFAAVCEEGNLWVGCGWQGEEGKQCGEGFEDCCEEGLDAVCEELVAKPYLEDLQSNIHQPTKINNEYAR